MLHMHPAPSSSSVAVEFDLASSRHAEGIVRIIEAATAVQRRYQFFVWVQSHLQHLLPHALLVCGAWRRASKELVFETFNTVPVPGPLLTALGATRSALLRELVRQWVDAGAGCLVVDVPALAGRVPTDQLSALHEAGVSEFMVHGVSRPHRPDELETLFLFAAQSARWQPAQRAFLDLLMPQLHATYLRVQVIEQGLGGPPVPAPPAPGPTLPRGASLTDRERQILSWVREGKHNAEVAERLGISPLTVKNHVQKILRKLGASNRAQAVAQAMDRHLL